MNGQHTEQEEHREFCRRIQQLMAFHHWKNEDVAARIGFSASTVSRIAHGIQEPTRSQIMRFAKAFKVTPGALLETSPPSCLQSTVVQVKLAAIERGLHGLLEEVTTLTADHATS